MKHLPQLLLPLLALLLSAPAFAGAPEETEEDIYVQHSRKGKTSQDLSVPHVSLSNEEINRLIRNNVGQPATIASLMQTHGLSLSRIQKATGYTRQEIIDYINQSRNPVLVDYLERWAHYDAPPEESLLTGGAGTDGPQLAFRQPPLNTCGITKPHRTATPTVEQLAENACLVRYKTAFDAWAEERHNSHLSLIEMQKPVAPSIREIIDEANKN